METRKFRHAIIAALASLFAMSLAVAGQDESAAPAEEDEVVAMEAAAEDVAIGKAAREEVAAKEMGEEMQEEAEEPE